MTKPMKSVDRDLVYDILSVPSYTGMEGLVRDKILEIAEKMDGVTSTVDVFGNVYLTKGELSDGEYYPCLSAHMDTVHYDQENKIRNGEKLSIKTIERDGKHIVYAENTGIGGDDKAGVVLALSVLGNLDKGKASFFVSEENGCNGSKNLDKEWFGNVGYVISYDSPGFNRTAYACSGVNLFDKSFFLDHLKDVFDKYEINNYRSEPYTDIEKIRVIVGIACINLGAGYYLYHTRDEYCVLEDMDKSLNLGLDFVDELGTNKYHIPIIKWRPGDDEYEFFNSLENDSYLKSKCSGFSIDDQEYFDYDYETGLYVSGVLSYLVSTRAKELGLNGNEFDDIFEMFMGSQQ